MRAFVPAVRKLSGLKCRWNSTNVSKSQELDELRATMRNTVPEHHSLLLLHTKTDSGVWPPNMATVSPLLHEIKQHQRVFGGMVVMSSPGLDYIKAQRDGLFFQAEKEEYVSCAATFFTKLSIPLDIQALQPSNLEHWVQRFREKAQEGVDIASMWRTSRQARSAMRSAYKSAEVDISRRRTKRMWILVCTHAARDCRCGEYGKAVFEAVKQYVDDRRLNESIMYTEVSHVGGHKWAANLLVYPHGDWYATVRPEDVTSLMDSLIGMETEDSLSGENSPLWRGSWFDHRGTAKEHPEQVNSKSPEEWGSNPDLLYRGE